MTYDISLCLYMSIYFLSPKPNLMPLLRMLPLHNGACLAPITPGFPPRHLGRAPASRARHETPWDISRQARSMAVTGGLTHCPDETTLW